MVKIIRPCIPTALFILLCHGLLRAQEPYKPHPLLSPMWQADMEYLSPSQVDDTTQEFGFSGASFSMRVPLWTGKDWLSADGGKPLFALISQGGVSVRETQIDYLEPDRYLSLARLGLTGLMASGLRNLYLIQITASLPSESFRLKPGFFRFHGAVVWRKLYHNNKWWHTLGVIYTPVRGRDLPLPLLGMGIKLGNEDQLQFTFPFNFAYTHLFSRRFSLSARLNNMGGYHFIDSEGDETFPFRFRYARLALVGRLYTQRHVVLTPEIGLTGRGWLQTDEVISLQAPTPYLRLSVQVRWGKRPPTAPILHFDPGDSGFDPAYLVE